MASNSVTVSRNQAKKHRKEVSAGFIVLRTVNWEREYLFMLHSGSRVNWTPPKGENLGTWY